MFRKIELWVVLLLCLFFFVGLTLYGALLKYHYELSGDKLSGVRKVAVFLAEIPYNLKEHYNLSIRISENGSVVLVYKGDMHPDFPKHKDKPRFKRFNTAKRDALLILPRFDGNLERSVVDIVDLNTFEVLHTYKHDINAMNDLVDTRRKIHSRVHIDDPEIRFEYRHPLVLEDGSLISHSDYAPLFKIDFCSELLWLNQERRFHHSIELDENDGNIWVGSELLPYSEYVTSHKKDPGILDDAITKISKDGKILYSKSILELLSENGSYPFYEYVPSNKLKGDFIHLNDITPAMSSTEHWQEGDVFISARYIPKVIHYRPSTNKVVNLIKGPFHEQHDVEIISEDEISIFNNNNNHLLQEQSEHSEVLIYNFKTKTFQSKFKEQLKASDFKTESQGLSETLEDGSMLVEEQNHGRLILFNSSGEKEWEFVNKDDEGKVYFISWSRIIEDQNLIRKLKDKIKNTNCLN